MQADHLAAYISVDEYLAAELNSEVRHEFVGGVLHAMAGASVEHNVLGLNLASALRSHLRGKPCQVFMSDVKVRLRIAAEDIFYYPDVMVACDPRDTDRYSKRHPKVLIEVLSPETERTDRREKFLSYAQIESLEEYALVAQDKMEVTLFTRANQWRSQILRQPEQVLHLHSLDFGLPLSAVYDGLNL